ncbi:MAG TPA: DUF721 domain-containing protein [Candidatus Atribacteria bacterium]|nr:DUF721 domain-containing protein [Candidatus Atribacteria bacterium]
MKRRDIASFREALEDFFKEKRWDKKIKGYQVINCWEEVVGEEIAQNTQPIKIQDQILFLRVKSSVWANELNLRRGEIINKINLKAKEQIIFDLRFRVQPSYFNT